MFQQMWQLKQMYDKYKKLQEALQNLIIRAGKDTGVIVEMTWEMKVKDVIIEDETLLSVEMKSTLENKIKESFVKAQTKAQEIAATKTKDILWFDPSDISKMMWGWGDAGGMGGLGKMLGMG